MCSFHFINSLPPQTLLCVVRCSTSAPPVSTTSCSRLVQAVLLKSSYQSRAKEACWCVWLIQAAAHGEGELIAQTYERMPVILCPKPVASWEKAIGICCIKPLEVAQVHTETDLKETGETRAHREQLSALARRATGSRGLLHVRPWS